MEQTIKTSKNTQTPVKPSEPNKRELTNIELERNDFIHNEIFDLINRLIPNDKTIEWDIQIIAEIADDIEGHLVSKGVCSAQEFSPYINLT